MFLDENVTHVIGSDPMLATLHELGVAASFSRPRVSDDNPFSEARFRTVKYRPEYPSRPFTTLEEAWGWVALFVRWCNHEHQHSAISFVTPHERHAGLDFGVLRRRRVTYERARSKSPQRWSRHPRTWSRGDVVRLNPAQRPQAADVA